MSVPGDHPGWRSRFGRMVSTLSGSLSAALDASRPRPNAFVVGRGFTVKWDMEREDSEVSAEFHIKKRRLYRIEILFCPTSGSVVELFPFTGKGTRWLVRKEEADSDNPTAILEPHSPEAVEHIRSGEYVWTPSRKCVMIPVHLKIERLSRGVDATVMVDRDCKTRGIVGSFPGFGGSPPGGLARKIATVGLRPGNYRLAARTLAPTAVPSNVETRLLLRYRVKY